MPSRSRSFLLAALLCARQLGYSQSASGVDLQALNPAVSACNNFYQYACGTWRKDNPIPPDRARWSRFDELHERNLGIERGILEKAAAGGAERTPIEQKVGDFYASCMDERAVEEAGVQPIEGLLGRIRSASSNEDLLHIVADLHRQGVRVLFNSGVGPDAKDASQQIVNVTQGGLSLPDRDYYLAADPKSVEIRKHYGEHVANMFAILAKAEGKPEADGAQTAAVVSAIETALAKASMERVAMRNPNNRYHKMTFEQLTALTPEFSWKQYMEGIGLPLVPSLNVAQPDFFKAMDGTAKGAGLYDLKTYFIWHVLNAKADQLTKAFRDESFRFTGKILTGAKEMPARWKRCVGATDRALGEAVGQKYVEVAFSGPSKQRALQLVGEIEKEMARDIGSADWMSAATKDQALTKLNKVANKIGYPEKWRDYSSVRVARADYAGNTERAIAFEIRRNLQKLGKPVDKTEWSMTPPTVNAYYSPPQNNINFPAGILQPPFYNPRASDAVNYGAIGVVIGHELTHGFDDQGRRYDGLGNLRDWWTAADGKAFETKAGCIDQEYGGFSPTEGVKLNGKLTLGENSADNGGIHLAYMALMDSLASKTLPKADGFTPQQQFFLGYAQIWCENTTPQAARMSALTNPHSPGEFRVNGVLQNLGEFREAFSCKTGDRMVSTDPCRVW